jgi:hypothetical protein
MLQNSQLKHHDGNAALGNDKAILVKPTEDLFFLEKKTFAVLEFGSGPVAPLPASEPMAGPSWGIAVAIFVIFNDLDAEWSI